MNISFYSWRRAVAGMLCLGALAVSAQDKPASPLVPGGKQIYIPREYKNNDFTNDSSQLSYHRMAYTDDFVVFWEKGFGHDLSNPPQLEGKPMKVDMDLLLRQVERFYRFYTDTLKFVLPGSKAEKYRMMAILKYSLEGTAYGGDYDNEIGALWIAPNRLQDPRLNCIAHELGHSFQSQIRCDKTGEAWGGGGIFEMCSQWMLWQVNPRWVYDEKYHWEAWMKLTHKPFMDPENFYHSPYVLEWWSVKRGLTVMGDLFRAGKRSEDPTMTYKRLFGLDQAQYCDEMFDGYRHLITYDWDRVREVCRPIAGQWRTQMQADTGLVRVNEKRPLAPGHYRIAPDLAPGNYGFNAIALQVPKAGKTVTIHFKALPAPVQPKKAGHRYGLVAVKQDGTALYSDACSEAQGKLTFKTPKDAPLKGLYLVVMGAPTEHLRATHSRRHNDQPQPAPTWPYEITVK